ncbi:eukaryotic translation initiation factor 3 subunit G-like [Anneissia japonica]|uniref:eukaryotic translation initiation factor 3 subunit G-like n=1 Tax=Anneissia japonica TaxID=1529436 RepID=UPI001425A30E|nr:eukaryotic translation initiation factor 3 subunit G-like [Anneissia japonica]
MNSKSWADQVEEERHVPQNEEIIKGNIKKLIEYRRDEAGKLQKVIRTFNIEQRKASKSVATRKAWPKFGSASNDGSGPNPATTSVSDDIFMQFITAKDDLNTASEVEDPIKRLAAAQKMVMCRVCKGDHWTTKCPYKDTLEPLQKELAAADKPPEENGVAEPGAVGASTGKYIPPGKRKGAEASRGGERDNKRDDGATIRVTNLSEDTREPDLQELFRPFGAIQRIYLAMDKNTGMSKGFAFINFHHREDAARAIAGVSGFGYDHLILKVEWAKPSGTQ